jgi:hypothetical protein
MNRKDSWEVHGRSEGDDLSLSMRRVFYILETSMGLGVIDFWDWGDRIRTRVKAFASDFGVKKAVCGLEARIFWGYETIEAIFY